MSRRARSRNGWRRHKNEADLGRAIETDATQDPDVRAALDTVLERLDAVQLAGLALSPDDRIWFHDTLREELGRLGNDTRFAAALNMVITGQGHHVSVIINQYADRRDGTDRGELAKAVAKYLYRVREEYGKVELRGIERQAVPGGLPLERVYVPLEADLDPDPELCALPRGHTTPEPQAVETRELLAHGRRLVVVGGPGSGKSTVLLHIASVLADALYRDDPGPAQAGLGIQSLPLPVFVPLNGFGRFLRDYPKDADPGERTLAGFISQYLRKRLDLPGDFFEVLMREGRALILLLDGLDEVADEGERALVGQAIGDLLANDPDLRAVVSCRTAAYQGRSVLYGGFRAVRVRPLDEPRIESLVRRYYGAICSGDPEEGGMRSDDLLAQIRALERQHRARLGQDAERFVSNPLMVRMLLIVHYNERRLPDQRAALYMKTVDTLLLPDYAADEEVATDLSRVPSLSKEDHRQLLQSLAFDMHRRGEHQGREIPEHEIKKVLKPEFGEPRVSAFIELTRTRGSVLEERQGDYRFAHLGYQEFLAARYLAQDRMEETGLKGVVQFFKAGPIAETWWREPVLLFAGYYAIVNPSTMRRFLQSLGLTDEDPSDPDVWLAAAEVAATALLEWDPDDSGSQHGLFAKRIQALFADREAMTRSRPALRARAGVTLAQLGDPRPEVLDPDFMEFCLVPGGEFWLGSVDEDRMAGDDEKVKEKGNYKLDYGYWMARFPVTNAQFERFVKDKGYEKAQYWAEAQKVGIWRAEQVKGRFDGAPRTGPLDVEPPFGLANHPVVGITWYEALAYTRWLTERWRKAGFIGEEQEVALPSEPEWEKAARGGLEIFQPGSQHQGRRLAKSGLTGIAVSLDALVANDQPHRRYPWGVQDPDPNRANYAGTGIGTTSAVGIFPGAASPYGCEEMSGNCWEWTRSLWGKDWQMPSFTYPYDPADGREEVHTDPDINRVLRGGSYYLNAVPCARRNGNTAAANSREYGFRVIVRPSL